MAISLFKLKCSFLEFKKLYEVFKDECILYAPLVYSSSIVTCRKKKIGKGTSDTRSEVKEKEIPF